MIYYFQSLFLIFLLIIFEINLRIDVYLQLFSLFFKNFIINNSETIHDLVFCI